MPVTSTGSGPAVVPPPPKKKRRSPLYDNPASPGYEEWQSQPSGRERVRDEADQPMNQARGPGLIHPDDLNPRPYKGKA